MIVYSLDFSESSGSSHRVGPYLKVWYLTFKQGLNPKVKDQDTTFTLGHIALSLEDI